MELKRNPNSLTQTPLSQSRLTLRIRNAGPYASVILSLGRRPLNPDMAWPNMQDQPCPTTDTSETIPQFNHVFRRESGDVQIWCEDLPHLQAYLVNSNTLKMNLLHLLLWQGNLEGFNRSNMTCVNALRSRHFPNVLHTGLLPTSRDRNF